MTIDPTPQADDHDRWCQYIFYRALQCVTRAISFSTSPVELTMRPSLTTPWPASPSRVGYARLNRGSNPSVTDSEVQLGKFVVPLPSASASPFTLSARALLSTNASALVPPIPLEAYVPHLHQTPPPRGPDTDRTVWTPERYLPEGVRFPARLYDPEEEHRFIVLTGEKGGPGAQYFMDREEKEWRRLKEIEEIEALKAGEGCPVQ